MKFVYSAQFCFDLEHYLGGILIINHLPLLLGLFSYCSLYSCYNYALYADPDWP